MSLLDEILGKTHSGACGLSWIESPGGGEVASFNPSDGSELGRVRLADEQDYDDVLWAATKTFERWRLLPAPQRGEIVREIGDELRAAKDQLGTLVTLEMGKILAEGKGEVQEMIDIADFATGLSRQLYGLSMHSERAGTSTSVGESNGWPIRVGASENPVFEDELSPGGGVSTAAAFRSSCAARWGSLPPVSGLDDGFGKLAIAAPGRDSQCSKYIPAIPRWKLFLKG